jgi:hypothetical protein
MAEDTPLIAQEIEETLETIAEEAVSESLPAEREARQQSCQEAKEIPPEPEEVESVLTELPEPKRKPGRPAGSKNKQPAKPRAKRVVVSEAVEAAELRSGAAYTPPPAPASSPPRWDAQHQPIPTEAKTEMAELMLRLLSGQAMERQRRKDAQRRAWFS